MQFETRLRGQVLRVRCASHGVLTVNVPWAGEYSRFTLMFEAFAIAAMKGLLSSFWGLRNLEAGHKYFSDWYQWVIRSRLETYDNALQKP